MSNETNEQPSPLGFKCVTIAGCMRKGGYAYDAGYVYECVLNKDNEFVMRKSHQVTPAHTPKAKILERDVKAYARRTNTPFIEYVRQNDSYNSTLQRFLGNEI